MSQAGPSHRISSLWSAGTWTISSITPDQGNIKINPCTGQLQVREATLNYESQQSYSATLVVTDDGKPSK